MELKFNYFLLGLNTGAFISSLIRGADYVSCTASVIAFTLIAARIFLEEKP